MHYLTPSAAIVALIRRENGRIKVLLQRRKNTGFADGMWDLSCSGHVEKGESISRAAARECREELGVEVDESNLDFFAFIHKNDGACGVTYYNAYFSAENFRGEPKIMEPDKCSEIMWFYIDELPADLLDDRKEALEGLLNGARYIAYGWEK